MNASKLSRLAFASRGRTAGIWLVSYAATLFACDSASSQRVAPPPPLAPVTTPATAHGGVRYEEATDAYGRFEKACRDRDANALWRVLASGAQADVNERMQVLYNQASSSEQVRLAKLDGEPDLFSPQDYLLSQFGKAGGLCPDGEWTLTNKQVYDQLYLMVRHVGQACEGLWFARTEGKVTVFPAGWYETCPESPAARVIADVSNRGRQQREQQVRAAAQPKGDPVTPAEVMQAYEAYTKACKAKDMDAMWALVPEAMRNKLEARAAQFRDKNGGSVLRRAGWQGDIAAYDARADFERRAEVIRYCPLGREWEHLAVSDASTYPSWLAIRATGHDRERCDVLEVTREGAGIKVAARGIWSSACPPGITLAELVAAE